MKGVDLSYWNGEVDFDALQRNGIGFIIARCSYGTSYNDETFIRNVTEAANHGMRVGAYHYSTALTPSQAAAEAVHVKHLIEDAGVFLDMPVFLDMEDADGYKANHSFQFTRRNVTAICDAWLEYISPLKSGIYANLDWFTRLIDWEALHDKYQMPVWNAQWGAEDDIGGWIWQFTDNLIIEGNNFDGNIMYDDTHTRPCNPWE